MSALLAFPLQSHDNQIIDISNHQSSLSPELELCLLASSIFQPIQPSCVQAAIESELGKEAQNVLETYRQSKNIGIPFTIRNILRSEIMTLCEWRHEEFGYRAHWDYLLSLFDCDTQGIFVATNENGDIIGSILGMNLNDELAFGGLYAVKDIYRCHGIGSQLWKMRLDHIGQRNMGINSVRNRIIPNQKLGMKLSFRLGRYYGHPNHELIDNYIAKSSAPMIRVADIFPKVKFMLLNHGESDLKELYLRTLIEYDASITLVKRDLFLRQTATQDERTATVIAILESESGEFVVLGYGMLRPRYVGYSLGPIYAENCDIAQGILLKLVTIYRKIRFDNTLLEITVVDDEGEVPTVSYQGPMDADRRNLMKDFIKELGLTRECYLYRMYLKGDITLPLYKAYAITSSEAFLL